MVAPPCGPIGVSTPDGVEYAWVVTPRSAPCLVDENGSGKSTLMKFLVGALARDAGTVTRSGLVGFCPQEPVLYEGLTCDEHFELFGRAYGMSDRRSHGAWDSPVQVAVSTPTGRFDRLTRSTIAGSSWFRRSTCRPRDDAGVGSQPDLVAAYPGIGTRPALLPPGWQLRERHRPYR